MLINLSYRVNLHEIAMATADFVNHRPLMRLMQGLMLLTATWLFVAFVIKVYLGYPTKFSDLLSAFFALTWILFYQPLHRRLVLYTLSKRAVKNLEFNIQITNQQIHLFNNQDHSSIKLPWKKISFIAQNPAGYIVPLNGLANAGKFIWLPKATLQQQNHEQEFLKLMENFNIKLKTYGK